MPTSPLPLHGRRAIVAGSLALAASLAAPRARAASASKISADSDAALNKLYTSNPKARQLAAKAQAILVFPKITKAGFVIGGQLGDGALLVGGQATGYYRVAAASFGFQAGAQAFGYALFFITTSAVDYLKKSDGWAIGAGPTVVVVDAGMAKTLDTTNLTQDVYAIAFDQKGLMAGLTLEGSKISRITPDA